MSETLESIAKAESAFRYSISSRGRRRNFHYHSAGGSSHGLMVCYACRQNIVEGEYRVRETEDAYITHHRACTADDPAWETLDSFRSRRRRFNESLLNAAIAFRDQWSVNDLDDLIEGLSESLARQGAVKLERAA